MLELELKDILFPILFVIVYMVIYFIKSKKKGGVELKPTIVNLAFSAYLGVVIDLLLLYHLHIYITGDGTLGVLGAMGRGGFNFIPFKSILQMLHFGIKGYVNILFNLVVIMPFPVLLKMVSSKISNRQCVLFSAILVAIVELLQYPLGRACDIDDFILNFGGAVIALVAFNILNKYISGRCSNEKC